ncbi:thioredoxin family protein [Sulfurimonas sp.]|uniref:thioredoxin family protein n=1 Tax=Sulfurimonas sp. TaxID=2022749 RepID=UPI0025E3FC50|nr:thioredoxin family protein [Sulfurimonas sp.]MDD5157532.1 thioredoxin family protein [Sulfurimonas sp.]
MKLLIFITLLLSTLYSSDLNWLHNYDAALKQAKKEKKGVYLFIGADVCVWCDKFKDMTLSDKSVMKRLKEEYVLLYMSRDRHKIPANFTVKGVPRHYFLTSSGKIIHEDRGSREVDGFFALLDEVSLKK